MSKSAFPLIDWISANSKAIATQWFKIIEWLLMVGALSVLYKTSNNLLFLVLTVVSVVIVWVYVFFSCSEWFYRSAAIDRLQKGVSIFWWTVISTLCCMAFFVLANFIGSTALEFATLQH